MADEPTTILDDLTALAESLRVAGDDRHERMAAAVLERVRQAFDARVQPVADSILSLLAENAARTVASGLAKEFLGKAPQQQPAPAAWPAEKLNRQKTLEVLSQHNRWRRGMRGPETDPRLLGLALDAAIAFIGTVQDTQPPCFPTGIRYTVERHGDGWAIYRGRDREHHGLNLGHLTECSAELAAMIEGGLNATVQPDSRPAVPLLPCPVCGGEAIAHQDKLAGMSINFRRHAIAPTPEAEPLRKFALWAIDESSEAMSFDGADVQDKAVELGLLVEVQASEPCGESCSCAEFGFPVTCYRPTPLLNAPQPQAAQVPEGARELIEQCRDALAEELGAWDIDPPLAHVKDAHDACEAWLDAAQAQGVQS